MLFLALLIVALVVVAAGFIRNASHPSTNNYTWSYGKTVGVWALSVAAVILLVAIIINAVAYTAIVGKQTEVAATHRKEVILQRRATDIGRTLKEYLIAQYPQYEQSTIDHVLKAGPDLILLKFPELRAADTFIKYANDYKHLQSAVYDQATDRTNIEAKIDSLHNNSLIYLTDLLP